jgi:hypothetical protein
VGRVVEREGAKAVAVVSRVVRSISFIVIIVFFVCFCLLILSLILMKCLHCWRWSNGLEQLGSDRISLKRLRAAIANKRWAGQGMRGEVEVDSFQLKRSLEAIARVTRDKWKWGDTYHTFNRDLFIHKSYNIYQLDHR